MLVGRRHECERIERLLAQARAGSGGALVIRGDAGIGKSALLDFAVESAGGMRVLTARGVAWEAEIAFAGALELLRPLLEHLSELPQPQRQALGGALALAPAVERDRFAVSTATLSLLARAASQQPLLLAIDDAHWLDSASLEALLFAGRRLAGEPVALVLAARAVSQFAQDASGLPELALEGLDREATARLAGALFGAALTRAQCDRIYRTTQGYPLALVELSHLRDTPSGLDVPVPVSRTVERAYAREIEGCAKEVRALLLVAAADDSSDVATVLAAAARLGLDPRGLEAAEAMGFIELVDGRLRFRHPLVRSAVYQGAEGSDRRAAHAALAESLGGDWLAERRAWHRASGTLAPDERVAADLEATARNARARSGYGAAARALERAARLTPDTETRARRLLAAADALWHAGRGARAEELLDDMLERTSDPLLRANAQHVRGRLMHFRGDPVGARELLAEEGVRAARDDRLLAAEMLASAFHSAMFCGDGALTVETAATAARLALDAEPDLDARLCALTGGALVVCGRLEQAERHLRRSIAAVDAVSPGETDPFVLAYAANSHGWLSEYPHARDLAKLALESARNQGAPGAMGFAAVLLTEYESCLGELDLALAAAAEAERIGQETNQPQVEAWSAVNQAWVAAIRGQRTSAIIHLERAQRLDVPLVFMGIDAVSWVQGTVHLASSDAEAAVATLQAGIDLAAAHVNYAPWTPAVDLVEACVRAGHLTAARRVMETLAEHSHQAWALAALARARGLVAGDDTYDQHFRASVEGFARLRVPLEEARSRLCHGERLRRDGRRVLARAQLRGALSEFERLRAEPWIERARAELSASGETLQARTGGAAIDQLTPQELHVALIVAAGMTNKEAAARLFLSTKTIEAHLHRTYRKLGIRSRDELAPLLRTRSPGAET